MGKFPAEFPKDCPSAADAVTMTLYHGCGAGVSTEEDFTPYAQSPDAGKRKRAERAGCIGWGLSVWASEEAARHAQKLFPNLHGKRHIFKGDVTPSDGRLKATPSKNDPSHHTFWCFEGVSLRTKFSWAWGPYQGQRA